MSAKMRAPRHGVEVGHRGRRAFDLLVASVALILAAPILVLAAIGILLSSRGPVLYRATRIGLDRRRQSTTAAREARDTERRRRDEYHGREFAVLKLRTMHVAADSGSPITSRHDTRVFRLGAWLRASKIDELPQLLNVIRGEMALVGPRPEAPEIVRQHYSRQDLETLRVPPGLTSPGSLHYYVHGEQLLRSDDAMQVYVEQLLPAKLAIDRAYLNDSTVVSDLRTLLTTFRVVVAKMLFSVRAHVRNSSEVRN